MSLRHLRRAELEQQEGFRKELKASKSHNALALHSSEESSVPEREATTARRSVFLQAVSSDAESSQEEADNANEAPSPLEKDSSAKNLSPLSFRDDRNDGKKRAKQRNRRKRRAHPAVPPPKDSREAFVESQIEDSLCNVQEEAEASSLPQISGNNSETSSCLYMERGAFDPDAELRRIFGREVLQRSRIRARASTRSRRQWLIAPVECHHCRAFRVNPWVRMVACEDSATGNLEFSLQFTEDYVRVQPAYYAALNSHDLHVLESFCDSHPKHLDGRLALSQALSVTGSHEAAFHMLTIAVCSLQSSFHYAFSPFVFNPDGTPQVSADSRNPLNRQLFACLLLYMIGLGDQGCHRSALEVCKLLLAMDLPNDAAHALLHLDYYALRSEKYDFLQYFAKVFVKQHLTYVVPVEANAAFETAAAAAATDAAVETKEPCRVSDLRLTMPNFAFSAALAYFLKASHQDISAVRQIKAEDVCAVYGRGGEVEFGEYHDDLVPHLLLMHAILLFPAFIRTLLKKLDIKGEQKVLDSAYPSLPWDMLLFSAPLWITGGPIHETLGSIHDKLLTCFVEKNSELWKPNIVFRWLHSCAAHLFSLCQEDTKERNMLLEHRLSWHHSICLIDLHRYFNVRISEFMSPPTLPETLMEPEASQPGHFCLGMKSTTLVGGLTYIHASYLYLSKHYMHNLHIYNYMYTDTKRAVLAGVLRVSGLHAEPVYVSNLLSSFRSFCVSTSKFILETLWRIGAQTARLVGGQSPLNASN